LETAKQASAVGFLRVLDIDADTAWRYPQAYARLRAGELQAIVVRGVYAPERLAPVVERLERHDPPFVQTWFPEKFRSWFYGVNVNLSEPGLPGYFELGDTFDAHLREAFAGTSPLVERVSAILSALDDGRPFIAPPGPRPGTRYLFTTLRGHAQGGYIPPHFDNEQTLRPGFAHLRELIEPDMSSFVLTLSMAQAGGALEVFDYCCEPGDARLISADGVMRPRIDGVASVAFRVPAGDMIIVDSGRYLHRVTPVVGNDLRWTACSFIARSRDGRANYCWG
jgi:hypothetical protein